MPQDQPRLERVPTFWEALIAEYLPNLANPTAMEENATLLQQGKGGNTPERMAKVLQVAGRGLADSVFGAGKSQVPQSAEEIGMELSPLGKAIGLIPPKFIRPMVERLRARVALEGLKPEVGMVVEKAITDNPLVASHLNTIRTPNVWGELGNAYGSYSNIWRPPLTTDVQAKQFLDKNPKFLHQYLSDPAQTTWGGNIVLSDAINGSVLQDTMRHEMNHAAQDVSGKLPQLQEWTNELDYFSQPHEIGSRISERRGRWLRERPDETFNYPQALEGELNLLENQYALEPEKYPSLNESIMYMNEQLKPKGLQIKATTPGNPLGMPASMAPRRRFTVEKIVLQPAQMRMFDY